MSLHLLLISRQQVGYACFSRIKPVIAPQPEPDTKLLSWLIECPEQALEFSRIGPIEIAHGGEWARRRHLDSLRWPLLGGSVIHGRAVGLRLGDDYFSGVATRLEHTRDLLQAGLRAAGFTVYPSEATYFTTVDITPLRADGDGMAFCEELPERAGVVAIPNQVFYVDPVRGRHLVRFACCKRPEVIAEAADRLATLAG